MLLLGAGWKAAFGPKRSTGLVRHLNNVAFGSVASVSHSISDGYWSHVYFSELRQWYPQLLQVCFSAFDVTPIQLYGVVMFRLLDEVAFISKMIFDAEEILRLDHAGICFLFEFRSKTCLKGVSDLIFAADECVARMGITCGLLDEDSIVSDGDTGDPNPWNFTGCNRLKELVFLELHLALSTRCERLTGHDRDHRCVRIAMVIFMS